MRPHLDLFSGIGGFALAAEWAGFTTVRFCEIDPFCQKVLKKHWPETPIHDDIRTLTADVVGQPIDLLTGGFPCQPFSLAGKQLGAADDRHLWPEMARVIDECRPRWVLGENTPGIIGMELDNCIADLESIGYEAWPVVIPAVGVGAWHQRQRVWIVAHTAGGRTDAGQQQRQLRRVEQGGADGSDSAGNGWSDGSFGQWVRPESAGVCKNVASDDTNEFGCLAPEAPVRSGRHPFIGSDRWLAESPFCGLADGIPGRVARLKALGNAIVPQVAYQIIRHMAVMP